MVPAHVHLASIAMVLVACGPRVDEGATSDGADGGSTSASPGSTGSFEPKELCPSLGLGPKETLLVFGGDHVLYRLLADGAVVELDVHPAEGGQDERWVRFDVSSDRIVTASEFASNSLVQIFDFDGQVLWGAEWERDLSVVPFFSGPEGVAIELSMDPGLATVVGGEVRFFEGFWPFSPPMDGWVAAAQMDGGSPVDAGWLEIGSGHYEPVFSAGDVRFFAGGILRATWEEGQGTRIEVSEPGTDTPHELLLHHPSDDWLWLDWRGFAGDHVLLADPYDFTTMARVDLSSFEATVDAMTPDTSLSTLRCGWPSIATDGAALVPLSDGEKLLVWELTWDGDWTPLPAQPMSGVRGASVANVGGSYSIRSIVEGNPCVDDPLIPPTSDTLVGSSVQFIRPSSGVAFSWDNLPDFARPSMSPDGKCAALVSGETEIVVVDLERGEQASVPTPAYDRLSFPGVPARIGALYGL